MSRTLFNNVIMFAAGAILGSVVTWRFIDTKYKRLAHEEIEEVREYYSQKNSNHDEEEATDKVDTNRESKDELEKRPSLHEYASQLKNFGYHDEDKEEEEYDVERPYLISPDEYGDICGYDGIELTYYADGVLAEELDIVDDIDGTVGEDFASHFGTYEDDAVHIRNDALRCDYEILRDLRKYSDIVSPSEGE